MNKIQTIFSTVFLVLVGFGIVITTSCDKSKTKYNDSALLHPCDNVICLNGATCLDGQCICPAGFEGEKCATRWSDRFVGNYQAKDDCYTGTDIFYNVIINADPNYAYRLRLSHLGVNCTGDIITANIDPEKTSFSIPMQNTCGNLYLSGYGNKNGNFINVVLTSRDTVLHSSQICSIVLEKQ